MIHIKRFELKLFILLFAYCLNLTLAQSDTTIIYFSSWNLENLFDTVDDPKKSDEDFLPAGKKEWTDTRLARKLENLASVIKYMNEGEGPDILAVQEVEHESLLQTLIETHLTNKKYKTAYAESPDNRGIDCGLIYNSEILTLLNIETHEIILPDKYPTRYIFQVDLKFDNETISVFVNHWPSRRGGIEESEPNRLEASNVLLNAITKSEKELPEGNIIIAGDFNDEPDNNSLLNITKNGMLNLARKEFEKGNGSYRFKEDWNMLDQILINKKMLEGNFKTNETSFSIIKPEFAITKTGFYKGTSIPTFGGRKYLGGYSDHFPVGIKILKIKNK